ncbi:unnamed protein product [Miscanthus lutarioriparius]|uniref:Uncharacterized protein n=1 Tax=Miscanthus lutarioriparius TaxID=422564 RepID=A0A811R3X8_9POAL|nr:unnamed protein product [Miscanthus lutarioriparius]
MASGFGSQGLSSSEEASVAEGPMKACCTKRKAEVDAATGGVEVPSQGRTSKRREGEPALGEKHADAVVAGAGGDGEGALAGNVNEQLPGDSTSGDSTSTVSDSSTSDDSTSTSSDSSTSGDSTDVEEDEVKQEKEVKYVGERINVCPSFRFLRGRGRKTARTWEVVQGSNINTETTDGWRSGEVVQGSNINTKTTDGWRKGPTEMAGGGRGFALKKRGCSGT